MPDGDEALTNTIEFTDNTVRKHFSHWSTTYAVFALEKLLFNQRIATTKDRIRNEIEVRDAIDDQVVYPEIVSRHGDTLEMERLEGDDIHSLITSGENARELGRRVGRTMLEMERDRTFPGDWNLRNIYLSDGRLHMMDFEFGSNGHLRGIRLQQRVTLITSARLLDTTHYRRFRGGLGEQIDISVTADIISLFLTLLILIAIDPKPGSALRPVRSTLTDLKFQLTGGREGQ